MSQVVGVETMPIYTFAASSRGAQHGSDSWVIRMVLPLPWRCWVGKRWPQGCRKDQVSHFSTTILAWQNMQATCFWKSMSNPPTKYGPIRFWGFNPHRPGGVFCQGTVRLLDQKSNTSLGLCSVYKLHYLWISMDISTTTHISPYNSVNSN